MFIYKYTLNLGKRIPREIKIKVLYQLFFFGLPVNTIAACNGIAYGSVYRIMELF